MTPSSTSLPLSVCIQHHPAREHLLAGLLERLGGGAELVSDPDPDGEPSPMRTYRECLRRTPAGVTNRLIVQDDTYPCDNFYVRALAAVAERPSDLIAFFVPGVKAAGSRRVEGAASRKEMWAQIGGAGIIPVVALCWPFGLIEPFLEFSQHPHWRDKKADDAVVAAFVKRHRLPVWATVPSLVEHPDVESSLIGKIAKAGKNKARVAALFAD